MKNKCEQCGKSMTERRSKRYCSTTCRVEAFKLRKGGKIGANKVAKAVGTELIEAKVCFFTLMLEVEAKVQDPATVRIAKERLAMAMKRCMSVVATYSDRKRAELEKATDDMQEYVEQKGI